MKGIVKVAAVDADQYKDLAGAPSRVALSDRPIEFPLVSCLLFRTTPVNCCLLVACLLACCLVFSKNPLALPSKRRAPTPDTERMKSHVIGGPTGYPEDLEGAACFGRSHSQEMLFCVKREVMAFW